MPKKQSKILAAVHATAKGLHAAGAIEQVKMRDFDTLCVAPAEVVMRQSPKNFTVEGRRQDNGGHD